MESPVDINQPLRIDMGIALGGGEVHVAEELLDGAQIGSVLKQVGREAVPQKVRIDPFADASQLPGRGDQPP